MVRFFSLSFQFRVISDTEADARDNCTTGKCVVELLAPTSLPDQSLFQQWGTVISGGNHRIAKSVN